MKIPSFQVILPTNGGALRRASEELPTRRRSYPGGAPRRASEELPTRRKSYSVDMHQLKDETGNYIVLDIDDSAHGDIIIEGATEGGMAHRTSFAEKLLGVRNSQSEKQLATQSRHIEVATARKVRQMQNESSKVKYEYKVMQVDKKKNEIEIQRRSNPDMEVSYDDQMIINSASYLKYNPHQVHYLEKHNRYRTRQFTDPTFLPPAVKQARKVLQDHAVQKKLQQIATARENCRQSRPITSQSNGTVSGKGTPGRGVRFIDVANIPSPLPTVNQQTTLEQNNNRIKEPNKLDSDKTIDSIRLTKSASFQSGELFDAVRSSADVLPGAEREVPAFRRGRSMSESHDLTLMDRINENQVPSYYSILTNPNANRDYIAKLKAWQKTPSVSQSGEQAPPTDSELHLPVIASATDKVTEPQSEDVAEGDKKPPREGGTDQAEQSVDQTEKSVDQAEKSVDQAEKSGEKVLPAVTQELPQEQINQEEDIITKLRRIGIIATKREPTRSSLVLHSDLSHSGHAIHMSIDDPSRPYTSRTARPGRSMSFRTGTPKRPLTREMLRQETLSIQQKIDKFFLSIEQEKQKQRELEGAFSSTEEDTDFEDEEEKVAFAKKNTKFRKKRASKKRKQLRAAEERLKEREKSLSQEGVASYDKPQILRLTSDEAKVPNDDKKASERWKMVREVVMTQEPGDGDNAQPEHAQPEQVDVTANEVRKDPRGAPGLDKFSRYITMVNRSTRSQRGSVGPPVHAAERSRRHSATFKLRRFVEELMSTKTRYGIFEIKEARKRLDSHSESVEPATENMEPSMSEVKKPGAPDSNTSRSVPPVAAVETSVRCAYV